MSKITIEPRLQSEIVNGEEIFCKLDKKTNLFNSFPMTKWTENEKSLYEMFKIYYFVTNGEQYDSKGNPKFLFDTEVLTTLKPAEYKNLKNISMLHIKGKINMKDNVNDYDFFDEDFVDPDKVSEKPQIKIEVKSDEEEEESSDETESEYEEESEIEEEEEEDKLNQQPITSNKFLTKDNKSLNKNNKVDDSKFQQNKQKILNKMNLNFNKGEKIGLKKKDLIDILKMDIKKMNPISKEDYDFSQISQDSLHKLALLLRQYTSFEPFSINKMICPIGEKENVNYCFRMLLPGISQTQFHDFIAEFTGTDKYKRAFLKWRKEQKMKNE